MSATTADRLLDISNSMIDVYRAVADLSGPAPWNDDRGLLVMAALNAVRSVDLDVSEALNKCPEQVSK